MLNTPFHISIKILSQEKNNRRPAQMLAAAAILQTTTFLWTAKALTIKTKGRSFGRPLSF